MRGDLPTAPSTGTGVLSPAPNVRAEAMPVRQVYLSRSRSPAAKPSAPPLAAAKRIFIRGDGVCQAKRIFIRGDGVCQAKRIFIRGDGVCQAKRVFIRGDGVCQAKRVFIRGDGVCQAKRIFIRGDGGVGNPRPVGSIAGTPVKFIRRTVLFRRVEVQQRHLITSVKGVNHGLVSRNHRSQAKRGFFNAE